MILSDHKVCIFNSFHLVFKLIVRVLGRCILIITTSDVKSRLNIS
jgi:hypothetical protein